MSDFEFYKLALKALQDKVIDLRAFKQNVSSDNLKAYAEYSISEFMAGISYARKKILDEVKNA